MSMDAFTAQQQVLRDQMANLAPKSVLTALAERNLALWVQMQDTLLKSNVSKPDTRKTGPRKKKSDKQGR
jgi:polyhydroxyalkanoate synthesis regulator protein